MRRIDLHNFQNQYLIHVIEAEASRKVLAESTNATLNMSRWTCLEKYSSKQGVTSTTFKITYVFSKET